ncbi:MAG: hypothetical protein EVA43_03550 [Flavobacteriales bacterium]|nr:MAG: hypothetical protein EVA43_03550 [Flavobacteriales bacterium]
MTKIDLLYKNEIGIVFKWAQYVLNPQKNINFIFRNTILDLDKKEINLFIQYIQIALTNSLNCKNFNEKDSFSYILLETPISKLSFSMSIQELILVQDLLCNANFYLGLKSMLKDFSIKNSL